MVDRLEQSACVPVEAVLDGKGEIFELQGILIAKPIESKVFDRIFILFKTLDPEPNSFSIKRFRPATIPIQRC